MNSQESPRSMGEAGGYWDGFVNGDDSFHKVMNMLDFPLESVEGDKCVVAENWEAQFQSFGPFSSENLHSFSPVLNDFAEEVPNTVQNDAASDRKPLPVTTEISSTRFTLDSSQPRNPSMLQTSSPNSVLESSGSCSAGKNLSTSHELLVPVRTRTMIPRRSTFSKLHSLSPSTPPKKISDIKGKKKKKIKRTRLLYESEMKEDSHHQHVSSKKCTHCEAEKTPQWREGPTGPRTLCNACGVHYQRSRQLPELQPIASPGSDTGKFPCTRRKEKKMKLSTELEKDAINQLPEKCQIVEDPTHPCKKCTECDVTETPQWREGPMGPSTLCNACGVRYRSGRLLPESHPTAGPNKNARRSTRLQEKKLALSGLPNDSMTKGVVTPDRVKRCTHCQATKTQQWHEGPMGPKTLCNACGVRYHSGSGLPNDSISKGVVTPDRVKRYTHCQATKTPQWREGPMGPPNDSMTKGVVTPDRVKRCTHCQATKTPQWREGPMGPKTLCNACGVFYRSGCLVPEYRPAASPTFIPCLHSNKRRNVIEKMRMREKHVPETSNSEKDPAVFPPA